MLIDLDGHAWGGEDKFVKDLIGWVVVSASGVSKNLMQNSPIMQVAILLLKHGMVKKRKEVKVCCRQCTDYMTKSYL